MAGSNVDRKIGRSWNLHLSKYYFETHLFSSNNCTLPVTILIKMSFDFWFKCELVNAARHIVFPHAFFFNSH